MSHHPDQVETLLQAEASAFASRKTISVKNNPPLGNLFQSEEMKKLLAEVEPDSHTMDDGYYRWLSVRKSGIPVNGSWVTCNTGFEGFFVGEVNSADELVACLLNLGKEIWDSVLIRHKNQYQVKKNLIETITGVAVHAEAVVEWSEIFAVQIALLRSKLNSSERARKFRELTGNSTSFLPPIEYDYEGNDLIQEFVLPVNDEKHPVAVITRNFPSDNKDDLRYLYWNIVQNIGQFGHPLVRSLIKKRNGFRLY